MVNLRHELNENLLKAGGHIGYTIRPRERKKGYGYAQLCMALEEAKKIGIKKALVTCMKDNIPSAKTIEKCLGVLENESVDAAGLIIKRYWIDLN